MIKQKSANQGCGLFFISKVYYAVTDQHPEPDESIPHNSTPFFYRILYFDPFV